MSMEADVAGIKVDLEHSRADRRDLWNAMADNRNSIGKITTDLAIAIDRLARVGERMSAIAEVGERLEKAYEESRVSDAERKAERRVLVGIATTVGTVIGSLFTGLILMVASRYFNVKP